MEKRIRSNEFGPQGCYFIRRLANNLGEPQRSYAINAIDRALTFWKAKRVRKPVPLRAPWLLAPNWTKQLRRLLTTHTARTKNYNTTLQVPSTGIVFTKYPSVMDSLCNHKEVAIQWASGEEPTCICSTLRRFTNPTPPDDHHIVLNGDKLHFEDEPLTSIATGSLQNKIFPPSKEIYKVLLSALSTWTTRNSLPSLHRDEIDTTPLFPSKPHHPQGHYSIQTTIPQCRIPQRGQRATSLRVYCPIIYHGCLSTTFADPLVFKKLEESPNQLIANTIADIKTQFGKQYPWALGTGKDLPNAYVLPKRKKQFLGGRPIVSFFTAPFRPMLNCIAKMIYHLLPKAFPHNLAKGDVFDLIKSLKDTNFDDMQTPKIYNQDLAGFFTSIDTDRFIDSWRLTLKFLSSTMSTDPDEIISVKATPTNTTGDVVKGRTCRTLNLTRKIFIRDLERIILMSLKMTQFSIGTSVYAQIRGSPMGSPLSPALCMMVVALSEEIWYQTYSSTLATMNLSSRLLRYVDNRLCLADPSWDYEICFANFLHPEFYGKPIKFWRLNPTRNSWAFALNSNRLHYDTAHHVILIKLWHLFRLHPLPSNFLVSSHDYFWLPSVRIQHRNKHEVLPHCTDCTERPAFLRPTYFPHPNLSENTFTLMVIKALQGVPKAGAHSWHTCLSNRTNFDLIPIQSWFFHDFYSGLLLWSTSSAADRSRLQVINPTLLAFQAMASSPTNTSIPLHEQVFQQFLHDVHHAYLLLHRAMALLPPTMIPNMEPTPLPSTGIWDQPEGLLPQYSAHTNAFIDRVELPPLDTDDEQVQQEDHAYCALPEPHSHVTAPAPDEVPDSCRFSKHQNTSQTPSS